jgi:hypothetical protein
MKPDCCSSALTSGIGFRPVAIQVHPEAVLVDAKRAEPADPSESELGSALKAVLGFFRETAP